MGEQDDDDRVFMIRRLHRNVTQAASNFTIRTEPSKKIFLSPKRGALWGGWFASHKCSVSFAECSLFDRALLQKRPVFLGSLLIVAISCEISEEFNPPPPLLLLVSLFACVRERNHCVKETIVCLRLLRSLKCEEFCSNVSHFAQM